MSSVLNISKFTGAILGFSGLLLASSVPAQAFTMEVAPRVQGEVTSLPTAHPPINFINPASLGNHVIISPVAATASSEFSNVFDIGNTIDQSGLSMGFTSGVTDFDAYLATNPTHTLAAANFEWFTPEGVISATVDYDLGGVYNIDRMALWNEESSGLGQLNILVSQDNVNFTTIGSNLSPFDNPFANYPAEVFDIQDSLARYVRLEVSGCPQPDPGSFVGCGIGEIAFSTRENIPPQPEPATILGLLAVSGLGLGMKRKKN
jgi:hypothetical protein